MSATTPQEVELKLALGPDGAAALHDHPLLAGRPGQREALINTYYDTPDGALESARIALRIRRTPQRLLQTLKTADGGSGGLSTRGEWEWEIADDALDLDGLAQLPPVQGLDEATLKALTASFSTDFRRQSWLLEHAGATIEVALDQGEIRAGSQHLAIDELELELKSGDTAALWQLALEFAKQAPLRPANVSKAARGTALRKSHWQIAAPGLHPRARFDHAILLLDALQDTQDPHFLARARATFEALAEDEALSEEASEHALALAQALTRTPWLTLDFGQHSLALQALLPAN